MEDQIITIATFPYSRAQLIRGRLEAEGIACFLSHLNLVQPDIASGVDLKISKTDGPKALKIIEEIREEFGSGKKATIEKLKNVRRILVPVDFSNYSINACNYALKMAQKLHAEIRLIYAYFDPIISPDPYGEPFSPLMEIDQISKNLEDEAKLQMEDLVAKLKNHLKKEKEGRVKISYNIEKGSPENIILRTCKLYDPGIIIMGTRGKGTENRGVIGSVTKKIIEKAKIPVLSIPQKAIFMGFNFNRNVLYASNFDDSDVIAIRKLMGFVRPFGMKIHCVHISSPDDYAIDNVKMDKLKKQFHEDSMNYKIVCDIIAKDDIFEGIEEYIDKKDIDLLALTTHKRGMFEKLFDPGITAKMLFHTNIPLLVFHS
jgi:nucleotide-binding universal stress UspA family protein